MGADQLKYLLTIIGSNLRKFRNQKGLSLRQFAAECGIDHSEIAKIEKGHVNVTMATLLTLSAALEIDFRDLFEP